MMLGTREGEREREIYEMEAWREQTHSSAHNSSNPRTRSSSSNHVHNSQLHSLLVLRMVLNRGTSENIYPRLIYELLHIVRLMSWMNWRWCWKGTKEKTIWIPGRSISDCVIRPAEIYPVSRYSISIHTWLLKRIAYRFISNPRQDTSSPRIIRFLYLYIQVIPMFGHRLSKGLTRTDLLSMYIHTHPD